MKDYLNKYEAVIGLEVHAELKTKTKIFCACSAEFGGEPNTHVCPVCLGMPGALPVLSGQSVELAVTAGIVLGCKINNSSFFDRKNYFYPDLPKGYQITQFEHPICSGGAVPIEIDGEWRSIHLERIHLEEDAGKLTHGEQGTLVDYNRCGVPLIEIVSLPEIHTAEEAKAYLNSLRRLLSFSKVSDCKMNEGSLRCDVNISVRKRGERELGKRCEIKNLNSVNYVGRAIEYEIERQCEILEEGGTVSSETRRFNEDKGVTEKMRSKEKSVDYRYVAEPNIPPLFISDAYIEKIKRQMPKTVYEVCDDLEKEFGVNHNDSQTITRSQCTVNYFTACIVETRYKNIGINLFIGEIIPKIQEDFVDFYISPQHFAEICNLFGEGKIVSGTAKKLIHMCHDSGESPLAIAENENMLKILDSEIISEHAKNAILSNEKAVNDYFKGKTAVVKQLIGEVMRATGGRADPIVTEKEITRILSRMNSPEK